MGGSGGGGHVSGSRARNFGITPVSEMATKKGAASGAHWFDSCQGFQEGLRRAILVVVCLEYLYSLDDRFSIILLALSAVFIRVSMLLKSTVYRFLLTVCGIVGVVLVYNSFAHLHSVQNHISIPSFSGLGSSSGASWYALPPENSDRDVEVYRDNVIEKYCSASENTELDPIPKVVHFIILSTADIPFLPYLAIKSALDSLNPDKIKIHYTVKLNEQNEWYQLLSSVPRVQFVHHNLEQEFPRQVKEKWGITHVADAMRLDIIRREGGIYFDTDVFSLKSMDHLLYNERDIVLGHEGPERHKCGSAVIMGRPNSTFVQRWIDTYVDFNVKEWAEHAVQKPKELSRQFPQEVCTLGPSVFFWPLYTKKHIDYMHEAIDSREAAMFKRSLDINGGVMYPNQLTYHTWNHNARKYLDKLDASSILEEDTRFNILVRRFVEPASSTV